MWTQDILGQTICSNLAQAHQGSIQTWGVFSTLLHKLSLSVADSLGCLVGAESIRSRVMRVLEAVEWDRPARCLCHSVHALPSGWQTLSELSFSEGYM